MSESTRCPKCAMQLPVDAPAGLCPKCLVQVGFESEPLPQSNSEPTLSSPSSSRFVAPSVEELANRFPQLDILELVGQGGMGAVYKARQPGLDRIVAVKILPPEVGRDPSFAERFTREARALARLSHPNIVTVHDFGQASGLYYFVMEFIDGANLRQAMLAGQLHPPQALAVVPQICDALQYAHDEGVVHRDIKPENILLDKRGRVKIADFGLSKLIATGGHKTPNFSLTGSHQVMGTIRYMAPEQMEGTKAVDHRADIYSLGVVFYEMLTGELPLGRFAPPSHKVQIDVRLDEVVLRSLEKEPGRRYQQAGEVKTDVEEITSGHHRSGTATEPEKAQSGVDEVEVVRARVKGPALGLLVAGAFAFVSPILLSVAITVYGAVAQGSRHVPPGQFMFDGVIVLGMVNAMFACPLAVVIMAGALSMMRLQARWLAITASILAVMPYGLTWLVSLPIGIWSLVVLNKREVEEAFRARRIDRESLHRQVRWLAAADRVLGVLAAVLLTLLIPITATIQLALDPPPAQVLWSVLPVGMTVYILLMIPSVLLVVAARKMQQLQSYAWAVIASLLVMLTIIGLPIGLWSLAVLTGRGARSVFGKQKTFLREPVGKQTEGVVATPAIAPSGTLARAWHEWWSERDLWFTWAVQTVLILVHFVCLMMFLSFHFSGHAVEGRHDISVRIGLPSPWFTYETYPEPNIPFRQHINLLSSSLLVAAIGLLTYYIYWRIDKTKADSKLGFWSSPKAMLIIWAMLAVAAIVMQLSIASRKDWGSKTGGQTLLFVFRMPIYRVI